jgi:hypothetical protein
MGIIDTILNNNQISMEQKITIENQTYLKIFATGAAIIILYFLTKKYLK